MQYPKSSSPDMQTDRVHIKVFALAGLVAKISQTPLNGCRDNLAQHTVLLTGSDNLGVHSHQVVVDSVLLLFLRFLGCGVYGQQGCSADTDLHLGSGSRGGLFVESYRLVHALAQLSLEGRTALGAVSM